MKVLSSKTPIGIRDAKIARKCYPYFDSFGVNRKLECKKIEILHSITVLESKLIKLQISPE